METRVADMLNDWSAEELAQLVRPLNNVGIVSDEDDTALTSWMIERWDLACDSVLRENGYVGGELHRTGNYFPTHGAVYCLYDSVAVDLKAAQAHLRVLASRPI